MSIKKILLPLLLLLSFGLSDFSYSANSSNDCSRISDEASLSECHDAIKDNAIMGQYSQLIMSDTTASMANIVLRGIFNDDKDRFIFDANAKKNQVVTAIMDYMQVFHGIAFAIMGVLVLPIYLAKMAKKGNLPGNNWGFFLTNFNIVMVGVGMGGVFAMLGASMLIGLYMTTAGMIKIQPLYYTSTKLDESHAYTQTLNALMKSTPTIIGQMINASRLDQQQRIGAYGGFSVEKRNGKFYEYQKETGQVTIDTRTIDRVFKGYAECISAKVGGVSFVDEQFVNPEFDKTVSCMKQAGIDSYIPSTLAYGGNNPTIQAGLVRAWEASRPIALLLIESTCSSVLNKDDNRARLSDMSLIYNQCSAMQADGSVLKENGEVQLYNSGKSVEEINSLFATAVADLNSSFSAYIKELQAIERDKQVYDNTYPSDMISLAISTLRTEYVAENDVTMTAQEEVNKILIQSETQSSVSAEVARMISGSSNNSDEYNTNVTRQQLINFDKVYDQTVGVLSSKDRDYSQFGLMASDIVMAGYFENSGQNFTDCFQEGISCITPMLNQPAIQYQNGQKMLGYVTSFYLSVEVTKSFFEQTSTSAFRKNDYLKSAKLDANVRQLAQVASLTKNIIWFYTIVMIFQSSLLYMAFVYHLFYWLYNFWIQYIQLFKEMANNLMPAEDETEKTNILVSVFKKCAWLAMSPMFAASLFYVNQAIYALLLTLVNNSVYYVVQSGRFGDYGVFTGVIALLAYIFITIVVVTGLLSVIIIKTNKIFEVLENWFQVKHSSDSAMSAVRASSKAENAIEARIK
ncbi:hypothetical protein [Pseudomonas orientalis]|nr:hypothetical protein [Pseudomonas orientalis]